MRRHLLVVGSVLAAACGPDMAGAGAGAGPGGGPSGPVDLTFIGPGADDSAPDKFGGAEDAARAPSLVYPTDGTLAPPNLRYMEFHFRPGSGNTLFRLTYQGTYLRLAIYVGCQAVGGGCVYQAPTEVWDAIGATERGQAPGRWWVSGVDGEHPTTVGHSASWSFGVGQEDILGGLYYWNAGAGRIMRYDFGLGTASAEVYVDPVRDQAGECVGCHTLSRAGNRMAFATATDTSAAEYRVLDVASRASIFAAQPLGPGMSLFAFNPDGTQLLVADETRIAWQDSSTGAMLQANLVEGGTMPDWAADGSRMVYATSTCTGVDDDCEDYGVMDASLITRPFQGDGFGAPTTVVSGGNNYYPSFSPDGAWILYNHADSDHSYDNPRAEVRVVPAAGGTSIDLERASPGGDSWPKWAPHVQDHGSGTLMWFTFSSRRAMGLRPSASDAEGLPVAQLWMAAFDPARAAAGDDPSMAAFWLPFQEPDSGNHIAQWTTEVDRADCTADSDCAENELCENGTCLPVID